MRPVRSIWLGQKWSVDIFIDCRRGEPAQKVHIGHVCSFALERFHDDEDVQLMQQLHSSKYCWGSGFDVREKRTSKPDVKHLGGSWFSVGDTNRISLIHTSSLICLNHYWKPIARLWEILCVLFVSGGGYVCLYYTCNHDRSILQWWEHYSPIRAVMTSVLEPYIHSKLYFVYFISYLTLLVSLLFFSF